MRPEPEGDWGYIDKTGTRVIPPRYAFAWRFSEGYARVRTDDKAGYIDPSGAWILRLEDYLAVDEFSDGVAPVYGYDANKYGFVDKNGKVVLEPRFDEAWGFTEGLAAVMLTREDPEGGLYGYIDKGGKWYIQPQFVNARPFSEGLAAVQREVDGKWGYIDKGGSEVLGLQWDGAWEFREGVALVATVVAVDYYEGLIYGYSYIDTRGNLIWQEPAPVVPAPDGATTTTTVAQPATTTTAPASGAATTTTVGQ
ncbi:MAG: hypothetical protein A2Y74_09355 [Actinobacteria bacterium RBG_13_63_9]|nr:MAG: hypothetical protein A2Y74_09355 [Actinobacteria bacterium RBG_13_63_9]